VRSFEACEDGQFLNCARGFYQPVEVGWTRFAGGEYLPHGVEVSKCLAERLWDAKLGIPNHGTKVTGPLQKTPTRRMDFRPAWWDLVKWSRSGVKVLK